MKLSFRKRMVGRSVSRQRPKKNQREVNCQCNVSYISSATIHTYPCINIYKHIHIHIWYMHIHQITVTKVRFNHICLYVCDLIDTKRKNWQYHFALQFFYKYELRKEKRAKLLQVVAYVYISFATNWRKGCVTKSFDMLKSVIKYLLNHRIQSWRHSYNWTENERNKSMYYY